MIMGTPTPAHVLMTADAVGGVWTYATTLAEGLGARGVRITLAVLGPPPRPEQLDAVRRLPFVDVCHARFALEWMPGAERDVERSAEWVLRLVQERRPDVVQINGYALATYPLGCPTFLVAHSCVCSWWRAVHGCQAPHAWRTYRQRVDIGLQRASRVVAPTAAMLRALRREFRWKGDGLVIHNGLPPPGAPPASPRVGVLAAGRVWDAAKNIAVLDTVAPDVDGPVAIAGDASSPDGSQRLPRHAEYLGSLPRDAVLARMTETAVYALPARYEPFGLSVLEAAQRGCALVLGDISTLRELWEGAAVFVQPDDRVGLTRVLNRLVHDPAARQRLAEAARLRATRYTLAAMVDGYLRLYRALARTGEAVPCAS